MLGDSVTQSDSPAPAGRRLRVVFVTDIVTPYMAAVFEALSRRSDLTVLFCAQSGSRAMPWAFGELPFRHQVIDGLTVRRRNPNGTDYYVSPRILRAIAAARPDGVVTAAFSGPTLYAAAYCTLRRKPLVIHSDGTSTTERRINRAQVLARRALLPRASVVVANSEPAADRFRELGVAPDRVFRAPHVTRLEPLRAAAQRRSYETAGPLHVIAVGRLIERKGLDRLLNAVRHARDLGADLTLELLGSGPSEEDLRRQVSELGLDNVSFAGFVDQVDLPDRYAAADAFAFTSINESFGVVLLEAMAAGLPVVASPHAGATHDLIEDERNGLVADPDDVGALAAALARLAGDAALRARLGRAAHATTIDRTPDNSAAGYLRALRHALDHPGSATAG